MTPRGFTGLSLGRVASVFLPLEMTAVSQPAITRLKDPAGWRVHIVGRLAPGVSDAVAGERLRAFHSAQPQDPASPPRVLSALPLETGLSDLRRRLERPLFIAIVMVTALLLIACANVATLLASRASARRTEVLIRSTMGAGRARLIRQFATEASLLATLACGVGLIFAWWGARALGTLLPADLTPMASEVGLDTRVLLFTVAVAAVAAAFAGLTPSLHTTRVDLASALNERFRSGTPRRLSAPLVIAQIALALLLIVSSGLLARTLVGLKTMNPGFAADRLVLASVNPGLRNYRDARLQAYYAEVFEQIRQVNGVARLTSTQFPVIGSSRTKGTIEIPGVEPPSDDDERWVQVLQVGQRYFETFGANILSGRDFTAEDIDRGARVAALSESAARRFFGNDNPIGRTIHSDHDYTIVAIVADARYYVLRETPSATLFVPFTSVRLRPGMTFAARVEGSVDSAMRTMHEQIRQLDPNVPVEMTTLTALVDRSLSQERLLAAISVFFAGTLLLLLVIGLYGVMAFWVADRLPEIGVRLALGAAPGQMRWAVLRQPLQLAAIGIVIGLPLAIAAARASASLLFGLTPEDALTLGAAALVVLMTSLSAGLLPAQRAMRVDPAMVLRAN